MATAIKERPILFSGPMVRAILDGRKTQTRRVIKPQPMTVDDTVPQPWPVIVGKGPQVEWFGRKVPDKHRELPCPFGRVGDRLWVRENFRIHSLDNDKPPADAPEGRRTVHYEADGAPENEVVRCEITSPAGNKIGASRIPAAFFGKLRPSIHMPRWASRITLEITGVKVERLQEISEEDAVAEGMEERSVAAIGLTPASRFEMLWRDLHGPESWASNPWVWAISFKRV